MVTKAYLANGKDGYDVLAKCNQVCELYGNTGRESPFEWVPEQLSRFLTDPTIATLLEHPGQ